MKIAERNLKEGHGHHRFVKVLDTSTEVAVYTKLPRGFFIPTPVGDYNPDWAIAFQEGQVKYDVVDSYGKLMNVVRA